MHGLGWAADVGHAGRHHAVEDYLSAAQQPDACRPKSDAQHELAIRRHDRLSPIFRTRVGPASHDNFGLLVETEGLLLPQASNIRTARSTASSADAGLRFRIEHRHFMRPSMIKLIAADTSAMALAGSR
jgi:hypothetical protein